MGNRGGGGVLSYTLSGTHAHSAPVTNSLSVQEKRKSSHEDEVREAGGRARFLNQN